EIGNSSDIRHIINRRLRKPNLKHCSNSEQMESNSTNAIVTWTDLYCSRCFSLSGMFFSAASSSAPRVARPGNAVAESEKLAKSRTLRTARPMSQDFFCFVKRTGDDVNADEFTDAPGSDGTRFGRGFNRSNIATHEDRDVAITEIFFANQNDVGRFYHRV